MLNQAGGNKEAVAEHALAMMLSLTKRIVEADRAIRREILDRNIFTGHDLLGQTVGIIGLGNVGKRLAQLCNGLFQMRVLAYDPYVNADVMKQNNVEKVDLDTLMRESDFVSVNCPLTDESRGLIGEKQYALMKPNAYFVTTARGNIHDEKALEEALRAKKIAGAGLDVWEKEPPPLDHPLLKFDNVMVSPHTAGVTHEARAQHGAHRGRADARGARRQAGRARAQPGGLAALCGAVQGDVRGDAGRWRHRVGGKRVQLRSCPRKRASSSLAKALGPRFRGDERQKDAKSPG